MSSRFQIRQIMALLYMLIRNCRTEYLFDNTDVVFIVFKNVSCDGALASLSGLRTRDVRRVHDIANELASESEAIYVVSNVLRSAIMEVAECQPFDGAMDDE